MDNSSAATKLQEQATAKASSLAIDRADGGARRFRRGGAAASAARWQRTGAQHEPDAASALVGAAANCRAVLR
jgi:hypothetical protein